MKSLKGMKKNTLTISYTLAALFMMTACQEIPESTVTDGSGQPVQVVYNQKCFPEMNAFLATMPEPSNIDYFENGPTAVYAYYFDSEPRKVFSYNKIYDTCEIMD